MRWRLRFSTQTCQNIVINEAHDRRANADPAIIVFYVFFLPIVDEASLTQTTEKQCTLGTPLGKRTFKKVTQRNTQGFHGD